MAVETSWQSQSERRMQIWARAYKVSLHVYDEERVARGERRNSFLSASLAGAPSSVLYSAKRGDDCAAILTRTSAHKQEPQEGVESEVVSWRHLCGLWTCGMFVPTRTVAHAHAWSFQEFHSHTNTHPRAARADGRSLTVAAPHHNR